MQRKQFLMIIIIRMMIVITTMIKIISFNNNDNSRGDRETPGLISRRVVNPLGERAISC